MLHAVIMAGGSGTRFWPKSRRTRPKQLLSLFGGETLLQDTVSRIGPLVSPDRIWVITGADQAEATRSQLPGIPSSNVVAEPCPRDTAPCIALAATILRRRDPDAVMAVLPADHVVRPAERFQQTARVAVELVEREPGALVTLGVRPTRPETGYGYIERGAIIGTQNGIGIAKVAQFREKPDRSTAEAFLASGGFVWNGGVFVWRADTILGEIKRHKPEIAAAMERVDAAFGTPEERAVIEAVYAELPKVPIDKAVMEKAAHVYVLEVTYDWSDVGDWRSLAELLPKDSNGNAAQGATRLEDTRGCIVVADDGGLIATLGIDDLVIVQSGGATLVARRDRLDQLKALVEGLGASEFSDQT